MDGMTDWWTDTTENITFTQLGLINWHLSLWLLFQLPSRDGRHVWAPNPRTEGGVRLPEPERAQLLEGCRGNLHQTLRPATTCRGHAWWAVGGVHELCVCVCLSVRSLGRALEWMCSLWYACKNNCSNQLSFSKIWFVLFSINLHQFEIYLKF